MTDLPTLHIDFETRSTVDLRSAGVHIYADHPTTDVLCLAWCVDDGPVHIISHDEIANLGRLEMSPLPYIAGGCPVIAHNASFELNIWNRLCVPRYGWPPLKVEQTQCTMVMAYALGLPGSLEMAAAAVGLDQQKDTEGRSLMLRMSKPRKLDPLTWWEDEAKLERLYAYCKQDVETERALHKRLIPLLPSEQALWQLDQKINDRGVTVDLDAISTAMGVVDVWKARLDKEMAELTDGAVTRCSQVIELTAWIERFQVKVPSLAKADVTALLDRTDLPPDVRRALELRREAAKTSTAKLKAMQRAAGADGRCRGLLQFHAASTGRWGGRRVQPQNFKRVDKSYKDIVNEVLDLMGVFA